MKHLNEATIQAFLDAELGGEAAERATRHLALCERCTRVLLKAEAEQAEVSFVFAAEAASPCPSQRIWARIENEIDFLGAANGNKTKVETKSLWQQLGAVFTPPQIAFASALAAVVLASLLTVQVLQQTTPKPDPIVADNSSPAISNIKPNDRVIAPPPPEMRSGIDPSGKDASTKVVYRPAIARRIGAIPKTPMIYKRPKSLEVLPEEHDYLNSIAELSKAVESSDEFVMRPSFRVDYERNLAVMNGAISAMQKQVRRNPKDENAKRILFASYQNKIELLNTVAEKSQMIASLR